MGLAYHAIRYLSESATQPPRFGSAGAWKGHAYGRTSGQLTAYHTIILFRALRLSSSSIRAPVLNFDSI